MARFLKSIAWTGLLMCLLAPLGACAVKKDNLYLFSAVKGRIVNNGEPVAGIKVERSTFWNMEETPRLETTYTDENGYYTFNEMTGSANFGLLAKLFHVPTISQRIYCFNQTTEILLYANSKGDYSRNSETGLDTIEITSDLKDQEESGVEGHASVWSEVKSNKESTK
jgi:hypothetical protein